jgi:hypothetical protein
MVEAQLVTAIASESEAARARRGDCARHRPRLRYERERAALQREIDRLQQLGAAEHGADRRAAGREVRLIQRIEGLI